MIGCCRRWDWASASFASSWQLNQLAVSPGRVLTRCLCCTSCSPITLFIHQNHPTLWCWHKSALTRSLTNTSYHSFKRYKSVNWWLIQKIRGYQMEESSCFKHNIEVRVQGSPQPPSLKSLALMIICSSINLAVSENIYVHWVILRSFHKNNTSQYPRA